MKYQVITKDGRAKRAQMETVHGTIQTPVFMNVGTVGAIKGAVSTDDLRQIGTQVELSNTYHLHVRTGDKLIKEYGGLHQFMNWDKPILTDSTLTDIRSSWDRKKVCRSSQILVPPLPWLLTSARQAMQIMIISAIP